MEEEKGKMKEEELSEINLNDFTKSGIGDLPPGEEKTESPGEEGKEGKEETKEAPGFTEVSLSMEMFIGMIGFALSMKYLPDKKAVAAFNKKYREELPKVVESFGMSEVFNQICASTLTFKIKESEAFNVPLPGWVGLVAVLGVLVVAGLFIKVPTVKKPNTHKDLRKGEEHGLTKEPRKDEGEHYESEIKG